MYATVRTATGRRWVTRKIAEEGRQPWINSAALVHDPNGGWVVAESRFASPNTRLQTISLSEDGKPLAKPQVLGLGSFGATARPTVVLAIDDAGRTVFAATTPDPNGKPGEYLPGGVTVYLREHGKQFGPGHFLGSSTTDPRVATASGGRAVVVVTHSLRCGDGGCRGASRLFRIDRAGAVGPGVQLQAIPDSRTSGPSVVLLDENHAFATWTHRGAGPWWSMSGAVQGSYVSGDQPTPWQMLDSNDRSSEPLAMPLAGDRGLVMWSRGSNGLQMRLISPAGRVDEIRAPKGVGPSEVHSNATNRDMRTAGRWAIVAWDTSVVDRRGITRVSVRRF